MLDVRPLVLRRQTFEFVELSIRSLGRNFEICRLRCRADARGLSSRQKFLNVRTGIEIAVTRKWRQGQFRDCESDA